MGLFDLVREVGDQIYASVALATATPASDETMAQVYDYWSMDNEDQDTLRVLKFDLGYGTDAHIAMEHLENIEKMMANNIPIETVAKVEELTVEGVKRILQMKREYVEYKKTGKLPEKTEHQPILGPVDKSKSFAKYNNSVNNIWNKSASSENNESASVDTPSNNNVSFADIATGGVQGTINTLADAISAVEK